MELAVAAYTYETKLLLAELPEPELPEPPLPDPDPGEADPGDPDPEPLVEAAGELLLLFALLLLPPQPTSRLRRMTTQTNVNGTTKRLRIQIPKLWMCLRYALGWSYPNRGCTSITHRWTGLLLTKIFGFGGSMVERGF